MAVKRRLVAGSHSVTSSGDATPTHSGGATNSTLQSEGSRFKSWSTENELKLFDAIMTHKPTGIGKHFQMALVLNKLSQGKQRRYS